MLNILLLNILVEGLLPLAGNILLLVRVFSLCERTAWHQTERWEMLEMERAVQPVRSGSRSSDPSVLQAELHESSPKCQAVLEALAAAARLCPGSLLAPK